jgi:hypothetical protein
MRLASAGVSETAFGSLRAGEIEQRASSQLLEVRGGMHRRSQSATLPNGATKRLPPPRAVFLYRNIASRFFAHMRPRQSIPVEVSNTEEGSGAGPGVSVVAVNVPEKGVSTGRPSSSSAAVSPSNVAENVAVKSVWLKSVVFKMYPWTSNEATAPSGVSASTSGPSVPAGIFVTQN